MSKSEGQSVPVTRSMLQLRRRFAGRPAPGFFEKDQAARWLGVSRADVKRLIATGVMVAVRLHGREVVAGIELQRLGRYRRTP